MGKQPDAHKEVIWGTVKGMVWTMHLLQTQAGEWAALMGTTAVGNLGWVSIIDLTTVGAKPEKQEL